MEAEEWLYPQQIADILKINPGTVSNLALRLDIPRQKKSYRDIKYHLSDIKAGLQSSQGHNQFNRRWMFPELQTKDFTDFWTLPWDEFIVASDAHCPYVDEEIFERMLKIADKLKIKNFLHAGDFFNQDQFSIYDTCGEDLVDWADEIDYSRKIYLGLKSVFKEIRFFMGSHDLRFWKLLLKSGKELPFNSAFKQADIPQKDTSRYRYARINDEWHVTHPRNVIKINSTPALRLGAKVKRSIIFGHGHWWGQYKDPSASHYQIAPGCLVNSNKIAYARLWDTSHDLWTNGFLVVVEKNKPILFEKKSPWGLYLGKSK